MDVSIKEKNSVVTFLIKGLSSYEEAQKIADAIVETGRERDLEIFIQGIDDHNNIYGECHSNLKTRVRKLKNVLKEVMKK